MASALLRTVATPSKGSPKEDSRKSETDSHSGGLIIGQNTFEKDFNY
jgi:hypothetical protein